MRLLTFISLVLISLICSVSNAETLVVTKSGYYWLNVNSEGIPSLTKAKIDNVIWLGISKPDQPEDPKDPEVPTTDPFEKHRISVQQITQKTNDPNKENIKRALARLYRTVTTLPFTEGSQIRTATNEMFLALELGPQWIEWKKEVDKTAHSFASLEDARKAFLIVAEVLEK